MDKDHKKELQFTRTLSPTNVLSLAVGCIIGWGAFVMPGSLFLKTAGPLGMAIGMSIGALLMIIIAMNYGYMVNKFPVAGGEFEYAYKTFGRKHAFFCAWFLGLSYLSIVPLNATALGLIGRYMLPGLLEKGYLYSIAGWDVYLGEILFDSLALILLARLSIKGIKGAGKMQTYLAMTLIGTIILLTVVAVFSPRTSISNLLPVFSPSMPPLKGIIAVVAIAPWAYVGFDTIPQASEEFNFSPKKARVIMICSIVFGGLMYIALNTITAIVFPWQSFIASAPNWATGAAVEALMGKAGLVILGIALVSAIFAGMIGFYMAASRLLFSMSRSKTLPKWFGKIHPEYKTPANAIKFVFAVSIIAPWFGREVLLWIVDMSSIGASIGYFYTSAATFKFVMKEKEGYTLIKITSVLGILLSLGFIALLVIPTMPSFLSFPSWISLLAWTIIGVVFYVMRRKSKIKAQMQVAFKQTSINNNGEISIPIAIEEEGIEKCPLGLTEYNEKKCSQIGCIKMGCVYNRNEKGE